MALRGPSFTRALSVAGELTVTVEGRSMRPFFPPDTQLRVRAPVAGERLLDRVVVAVDDTGRQLAHRVVADERDVAGKLRLRGDASKGTELVSETQVLGVVTAVHRGGRWFSVERVPSPLRRAVPWLGRQLVMAPWRTRRIAGRAAAV